MLLAVSSTLTNQQYILNKVCLNGNVINKVMYCLVDKNVGNSSSQEPNLFVFLLGANGSVFTDFIKHN